MSQILRGAYDLWLREASALSTGLIQIMPTRRLTRVNDFANRGLRIRRDLPQQDVAEESSEERRLVELDS